MPTQQEILASYVKSKSSKKNVYKPTKADELCAELASKYGESLLRGATVFRATHSKALRDNLVKVAKENSDG